MRWRRAARGGEVAILGAMGVVAAIACEASPGAGPAAPDGGSSPGVTDGGAPTDDALGDGGPASSTGGDADAPEGPSGPPAPRLVGRFDTRDPAGPVAAWPGCRILVRFEGAKIAARLRERADAWMDGGPSEWDVVVDGVAKPKLALSIGEHDYELASGLGPGPHEVELYKRSEAHNGTTQLVRFDFGDAGRLLSPPPRAKRRLEIVGDSTPASFGVEGTNGSCGLDKAARNQNFRRSFGARLGEIFGAEVHGTVYSGKGLVRNIWRPDEETMPKILGRANPLDPKSTVDPSTTPPDVVVVMLGGLDFAVGQPVDDGPTPLPEFVTAYRDLLTTLRGSYPVARILAVVSPSVVDLDARPIRTSLTSGVTAAVDQRRASGDVGVELVVPSVAQPSELTGCGGHGNPAFHERVAQELATRVRATTSWK